MGAIQGAINSMMGTVAAAAVGTKKLGEMKEAETLEGIKLTEEVPAMQEQIAQGAEELTQAQAKLEKTKSGRNELGQFRKRTDVMKDVKMQELAVQSLQGKQEAQKMKVDYMQKRLNQLRGVK